MQGNDVPLSLMVRNDGTADAGTTALFIHVAYTSRPAAGTASDGREEIRALAPGAEHALEASIQLDSDLAVGDYTIWVQVDAEGELVQADPDNDWASLSVRNQSLTSLEGIQYLTGATLLMATTHCRSASISRT